MSAVDHVVGAQHSQPPKPTPPDRSLLMLCSKGALDEALCLHTPEDGGHSRDNSRGARAARPLLRAALASCNNVAL